MMTILDVFKTTSTPKPIITSRPIFQHASSFLNDDDEEANLQKHVPLPLFHKRLDPEEHNPSSGLKPDSRIHLILHILNTIFTTISLILFITVIPIWNANFQHTRSLITSDYTDGIVLAPLLFSLLSSTYILVKEHTSFGQHLRPRFSTATSLQTPLRSKTLTLLSLTVLVTLAPALTLSAINSLALSWRSPTKTKTGLVVCNLNNVFTQQCQPIIYQIGGLQIGGIATGGLAWVLWGVMLVVAVRNWARQRAETQRMLRERRHTRRRGHRHRHHHGSECTSEHRNRDKREHHSCSREDSTRSSHQGRHRSHRDRGGPRQHKPINGTQFHHSNYQSRPRHPIGDHTAQMVSHILRPSETIQVWLNNRNT